MARYHLSPQDGKPRPCSAKHRCEYADANEGAGVQHYKNKATAEAAYAANMKKEHDTFNSVKKQSKRGSSSSETSFSFSGFEIALMNMKDYGLDDTTITKIGEDFGAYAADIEKRVAEFGSNFRIKEQNELLTIPFYPVRDRGTEVYTGSQMKEYGDNFSYLRDSFDDVGMYLVVTARQGGGNRECWHDEDECDDSCLSANNAKAEENPQFVADVDQFYDTTYNDLLFELDITQDDYNDFLERNKQVVELEKGQKIIEMVRNGDVPMWAYQDLSRKMVGLQPSI